MYVLQHPEFNLGNFINLTPTIRYFSEQEGKPIPVFFATEYVKNCFLDCPFIRILDENPPDGPLFSSSLVNPVNDQPDYQYIFERLTGKRWEPKWNTYIDRPGKPGKDWDILAVINGSGSESAHYVAKKDPGEMTYRHIQNCAPPQIVTFTVGSLKDLSRNPYMLDIADNGQWGNIRECLKYINMSTAVIANDTGLAHAAGAMNKPLLVLWKDTPSIRCKNAGIHTVYSYTDHEKDIETFLNKHFKKHYATS